MQKRKLLYAGLIFAIIVSLSSCFFDDDDEYWFNDDDVSIHVREDDDDFRMRARFDEGLSNKVEAIINAHLKDHHSHALMSRFTDREMILEDGSRFYVKAGPGRLRIRIDKDENSDESCESLREMCEEIKAALADDNE
jgi:hypothetical protein